MYEVRVSNGNNDVMFITEEEKMRVLRNRLETERKANRKLNQFIMMLRETAVQKCIAVILVVIALVGSIYTQAAGIFVVSALVSLALFLPKRNIFKEVEEWDEL